MWKMERNLLILVVFGAISIDCVKNTNDINSTDVNKDMYVINAMVYQVGIVTNKTGNGTAFNTTGNEESLTLYRNNGSLVDLGKIAHPLLTNVTAQSLVGLAPVYPFTNNITNMQWKNNSQLNRFAGVTRPAAVSYGNSQTQPQRYIRNAESFTSVISNTGRYLDHFHRVLRREITSTKPVVVHEGNATIPQTAGVQSIAIPPLISFNTNLSHIPLPIPNTSVVHYAKINTLVTKP